MASQRPSPPWWRPQSRPCGHTLPAQASFPCRFPPLGRAHTPADWGHGGTRNSSTSRRVHTWSVNPAAIAGVQGRHVLAEPMPLVGSGCACGAGRRCVRVAGSPWDAQRPAHSCATRCPIWRPLYP